MEKSIVNRDTYKKVKKMNRKDMELFLMRIYSLGFEDGVEAGDNADFKIRLVEVLQGTKGVGEKTIKKVLQTVKELEQ